jgi:5-methylcytosine-specific restriction endonuclease McrA
MISCRKCGKVCKRGNGGLCPECSAAARRVGHGSSAYQANAAKVRNSTKHWLSIGVAIRCGICTKQLLASDPFSVDHIIRLRDGGSNAMSNLRPVHSRCNSADH